MLNFKREYTTLENGRNLYPISFSDKSKCEIYGRKKFVADNGNEELSGHVFKIPKDNWTFNAGQIDFTNYPDGVWLDYISICIVEYQEYTAPEINFSSVGDITPENLRNLTQYFTKHLSDLEKRIVEDYIFIDEGAAEDIRLPNLPNNHFWAKKNNTIVGVKLDYLKDDYNYLVNELSKFLEQEFEKFYNIFYKKMEKAYKDFVLKIVEEITGASEKLIKEIEKKINIYFETEVKKAINEYIEKQKNEILIFIEENKENLRGERGYSVSNVSLKEEKETGNIYDVYIEDGSKIGEFIAPRGPKGESIVGPEGPKGDAGIVLETSSQYAFSVNAEGHLILHYMDEATPPDFAIDENGHLILTL